MTMRAVRTAFAQIASSQRIARRLRAAALLVAGALLPATASLGAQDVRIRDLVRDEQTAPVRLLGYGLVTGLDGTGDHTVGGSRGGGVAVQSVLNVLQRFGVTVPPGVLRARNVAAVLVTAEVSPYLRVGAHFDIHVASIGDARSLAGGVLWVTPLVADPNGPAFASAQGALVVADAQSSGGAQAVRWRPSSRPAGNSATIADGGVLELALPRTAPEGGKPVLALRSPDRGMATRIAAAINAALGAGSAKVEDPGAVTLTLKGSPEEQAEALAKAQELRVRGDVGATLVVDARTGLVVAGGEATVQAAMVSVGDITLSIGLPAEEAAADSAAARALRDSTATPGASPATDSTASAVAPTSVAPTNVAPTSVAPTGTTGIGSSRIAPPLRLSAGVSVAKVAEALRASGASGAEIAAVFTALRRAGALAMEVTVR